MAGHGAMLADAGDELFELATKLNATGYLHFIREGDFPREPRSFLGHARHARDRLCK